LYFPVRHGEGKLIAKDGDTLDKLARGGHIALQYTDQSGAPTQEYPANPNGSDLAIAGLTDPTGRIFGLMPHPEAYNHPTNHPSWSRGDQATHGTAMFGNGIDFLRSNPAN
jgi:phosphoribosylformylglycinamidine synthase